MAQYTLPLFPKSNNPLTVRTFRREDLDSTSVRQYDSFLHRNCNFGGLNNRDLDYYVADLVNNANSECLSMFTFKLVHGKHMTKDKLIMEIYDVCTSNVHRRKGYAELLIKSVRRLYNTQKNLVMWLGVELTNVSAQQLYIKIGFTNPRYTSTSPSGIVYGIKYISLTYKSKQTPEQQKQTREQIDYIIEIAKYEIPYQRQFTINIDDLRQLKTQTRDKKEWSCCWDSNSSNELRIIQDSWNYAEEEYQHDSSNLTNMTKSFTVPLSNESKFKAHTHPWVAYNAYDLAVAWPSTPDYMNIVKGDDRIHMVVTPEGVYMIETPIQARLILQYLQRYKPSCSELFVKIIEVYINTEYARKVENVFESSTQQQKHRTAILQYKFMDKSNVKLAVSRHVSHMNNLTLHRLVTFQPTDFHDLKYYNMNTRDLTESQNLLKTCLKTLTDLDIQLIKVKFQSWTDIKSLVQSKHPITCYIEFEK